MATKKHITNKQIKAAIKASGGLLTHAGKMLGITQQAINYRVRKSPDIKAYLEEIRSYNVEIAESELMKLIKKGDFKAIKFYLICMGRDRGYHTEFNKEIIGKIDHNVKIEKIERIIIDPVEQVEFKSKDPVIIAHDTNKSEIKS